MSYACPRHAGLFQSILGSANQPPQPLTPRAAHDTVFRFTPRTSSACDARTQKKCCATRPSPAGTALTATRGWCLRPRSAATVYAPTTHRIGPYPGDIPPRLTRLVPAPGGGARGK
eukprot:890087-Pyramimonas_sp.AAC.1